MEKERLTQFFEEQDIEYESGYDEFTIYTRKLDSDALDTIQSCGAGIEIIDDGVITVFSDYPEL